ncbi:MAG: Cd(II)/Pb(II)-responsive transcriptional regulator [Trueperaceae bacterium]
MQIGELARAARCSVATIRYYEQAGLLPEPARTDGNFRTYAPLHLERLRTIRNCRALDLSLDEIRALLAQASGSARDCAGIDRVIDDHLADVDERIEALQRLRDQLQDLRARCDGAHEVDACGVWSGLTDAGSEERPRGRPER